MYAGAGCRLQVVVKNSSGGSVSMYTFCGCGLQVWVAACVNFCQGSNFATTHRVLQERWHIYSGDK